MSAAIAVRVSEITDEAVGVRSLRLVATDGSPLGPYAAGAHVDVVGPTGVRRQYSLCSPPHEPASVMIAVKREPASRGGSAALHEIGVGATLQMGAPRNLLAVAADADRHLLVAGGIGVTPLLSMAYELHRRGADFALHYFARSRAEAAFADLLEHRAAFRDRVHLRLGVPRTDQPAMLRDLAAGLGPTSHVYTCGPEGFMAQVTAALAPAVGAAHVHVERFVPTRIDTEIDTSGDRPFVVELETGEEFEVPADRTILSVLQEHGVEVFTSCEEGVCGSCVSGVLEGEPDHRDSCLSAADRAANDQLALCVSRARSARLTIELH